MAVNRFERILVPLDGSALAECVLPHAVAIAQALAAEITLLHVVEGGSGRSTDPLGWHVRKAEAQAYLSGVAGRLREIGLQPQEVLLEGSPAERIVEYVCAEKTNLVVLSSHGRSGLTEWNVSSVVQKIILRSVVPTLTVRAYQPVSVALGELRYRVLLLPLDGSPRAECVLPVAEALAGWYQARLMLATAVAWPELPHRMPLSEEEKDLMNQIVERNRKTAALYLEDLQAQLSPQQQVETRLVVAEDAVVALHELATSEHVDMVILTAHGYTGCARWPYGRVALNFIAYGTVPLLIMQDLSPGEIAESAAAVAARQQKGH
jgi:nucleotide-binding universal stress UspA family protein